MKNLYYLVLVKSQSELFSLSKIYNGETEEIRTSKRTEFKNKYKTLKYKSYFNISFLQEEANKPNPIAKSIL